MRNKEEQKKWNKEMKGERKNKRTGGMRKKEMKWE